MMTKKKTNVTLSIVESFMLILSLEGGGLLLGGLNDVY